MAGVNSGISHAKELLQKSSAVWARALKNIHHPRPMPIKFEEYWFKERQIISLPEEPICIGPAVLGKNRTIVP
jgi:hypothetical protein